METRARREAASHRGTLTFPGALSSIMERYADVVFNEPNGRRLGLFFVSCSIICILGYVYYGAWLDGPHNLLFMGTAFALSGFAESLPANRRRVAGVLRIAAVGILVGLLVLLVSAPELVMD